MSRDSSKQAKLLIPETKMINSELFTLTYGALVSDLVEELNSADEVNRQLDKIGYNIGLRMADDFLAKNPRIGRCSEMQQVAEIIAKHGLKTYLGVTAQFSTIGNNGDEFALIFDGNPLVEFVEMPAQWKNLCYSQIICGTIRGVLEAIHMEVQVVLISDVPNPTEITIKFLRHLNETVSGGNED